MKILFVNPNVTEAMTESMVAEARRYASLGTELLPVTARFGTQYVENRVEQAIAAHAVLECVARCAPGCDAAIISAFGDPGLLAARELLDIPVVGLAEAALLTAHMLGGRYSIVCLTPRLRAWYMESAANHQLAARLASVLALDAPVTDILRAKEDFKEELVRLCMLAVERDDAEVIIFGGGPIAGLAREVVDRIPVPTLDGIGCAVRQAEALAGLLVRAPTRGSFVRPTPKPARGLSPELMQVFAANPQSQGAR